MLVKMVVMNTDCRRCRASMEIIEMKVTIIMSEHSKFDYRSPSGQRDNSISEKCSGRGRGQQGAYLYR